MSCRILMIAIAFCLSAAVPALASDPLSSYYRALERIQRAREKGTISKVVADIKRDVARSRYEYQSVPNSLAGADARAKESFYRTEERIERAFEKRQISRQVADLRYQAAWQGLQVRTKAERSVVLEAAIKGVTAKIDASAQRAKKAIRDAGKIR